MNDNIKDFVKIGLLVFIYVTLGIIGVYSTPVILLLPLLTVPMSLFLMSNQLKTSKGIKINIFIAFSIFLLSGNLIEVIFYILNVTAPAYIVAKLYKEKIAIPQLILYTTTAIAAILCTSIIALQYFGVDYISYYNELLETYQTMQLQVFNTVSQYGLNTNQIELLEELIQTQIEVLKVVYPAIFFVLILWGVVLQVAIITLVGKMKKWTLPSLKQLLDFKLSKVSALLFISSFLLIQGAGIRESMASMLGWNLFFLISSLYQFIGVISIIMLLKRARFNKMVKVLASIMTFILIYSSPSMLMIFGLLDTMFNYRKVKNVV
ncbi:MAG: DUF2232 domain-containing protein [Cellulosilyticaceae bacterium]